MKKQLEEFSIDSELAAAGQTSPLDLERLMGGKAHPVGKDKQRHPDSMLAVYKNRLTYTFIMDNEVASIHYDRSKGEIFYKGHNVKNIALKESQRKALLSLKMLLEEDEEGREFIEDYGATLERSLADNK